MADRNCKLFSPNYFNPTKCQNCFKSKEQHSQDQQTGGKLPLGPKRSSSFINRKALPVKSVLKESILLKGLPGKPDQTPEKWEKFWFTLYSNGELQEFGINGGQINKEQSQNCVMLQDFIRMLDGKNEIAEDLCFGVKTLRDTIYFKTLTRVDYEHWWKEFSSFVAAPLTRSGSSVPKNGYSKPKISRYNSSPSSTLTSKPANPCRNNSPVSKQSDDEMENLRNQVSKLEEENTKLSKVEADKRKLELEVNYWKEYVTNAQSMKKTGISMDAASELADTRNKLIQSQDECNEMQKRLKTTSGKLIMQNRELTDAKSKLQEANSLVAVYKARIDQMTKELSSSSTSSLHSLQQQKQQLKSDSTSTVEKPTSLQLKSVDELFFVGSPVKTPAREVSSPLRSPSPEVLGAQHFEDKFLVLKDRMKRIERELFLKSKELEKANESRSKVAKYTRSLLQELETRLSDTQQKLTESEEKLKHVNTELKMERERRKQLEDGPRRRMSSVASPPKSLLEQTSEPLLGSIPSEAVNTINATAETTTPQSGDLTEHDADTKYADYYRSRFKEAEEALLVKDKKLHQAEEKIKQMQDSVKTNSDSYKVINELQTKLSDATHKLSDRQLKIHELTREIDRLKAYENTYQKKVQQCDTLEEIVKDLENTNKEQSESLHQIKQDVEIHKIREVVLKEQLQTLMEDSDDEDDDGEDNDMLGKSIALKAQINNMIELEALVKKLTNDNENLTEKNTELEVRIRQANIQHFKTIESGKNSQSMTGTASENNEKVDVEVKLKDLENKLLINEERHCNEMTTMKNKHFNEISIIEKKHEEEKHELSKQLETFKVQDSKRKTDLEEESKQLVEKIASLDVRIEAYEEQLQAEKVARKFTEDTLAERTNSLKEIEERCKRVTTERDALKDDNRSSYGEYDDESAEKDDQIAHLTTENHGLKVKVRQIERNLRFSLEQYEDIVASMKEKGVYNDGKDKDRDSGIVITQEIKNLMDSFKKDDNLESMMEENLDISNLINNVQIGVDSEAGELKYKKLSANLSHVLKDLGRKFIVSEQKYIDLAKELEVKSLADDEQISKYNNLLERVEDLNQQIQETQESLQAKTEELERERTNVYNLVEVTSAYIKELEGSLTESRTKIQQLQEAYLQETTTGGRQPPDGSSDEKDQQVGRSTDKLHAVENSSNKRRDNSVGEFQGSGDKDRTDGLMASKPKNEAQDELNAKIKSLESSISELKETHQQEIHLIRSKSQSALDKLQHDVENEDTEQLLTSIRTLEEQLDGQKNNYEKEIAILTQRFQSELKAAFGNDSGSMDILHRAQDLEIEIEETRKDRDAKLKEMYEQCEKEKQQMKDDMATVLQASLAANMGGDFGSGPVEEGGTSNVSAEAIEKLEDRVIKLEQELIDQRDKHDEELEMEKKAHQTEMEDTIRDMMMVRAASASCDPVSDEENENVVGEHKGRTSKRSSIDQNNLSNNNNSLYGKGVKKVYSDDDLDAIKEDYEKKLEEQSNEHQEALDQVRADMAIVISSLKEGSSSDTIMDLQSKMKELEQDLDDTRADYEEEVEELKNNLKRTESKNFFAMRRNEEMGAKIYQMQNEIEEMDRKHSLEIQIYQDKLSSLGGGEVDTKALEYMKVNANLEDKLRAMELSLNAIRNERQNEMDSFSMKLREEKRAAIEEMTDKVLKLEAIIEDMKDNHREEVSAYEKLLHDEKNEANTRENKRIDELENTIQKLKLDFQQEIEEIAEEHKKVVEELRISYEKKIGDIKKRASNEQVDGSRKQSNADLSLQNKQMAKELKEKHEKEIEMMKWRFSNEKQLMEQRQLQEIEDIRMQYDEKLKIGYKEGLRRQSVSERRTDAIKVRDLTSQKESLETKLLELEIKHGNDIKVLETKNLKLQNLVSELKNRLNGETGSSSSDPFGKKRPLLLEAEGNSPTSDDDANKKLKEIQEQIERYERRIEYYREKSQREKTEESHRVSELQSEIVELHKEMNRIRDQQRKQAYEKERKEKNPSEKTGSLRRNTDGSIPPRRHTDSDTVKTSPRPRDPKKRWSNLEERTEKEEGKYGSVSARKSLWESKVDESTPTPSLRSLKTQSLPRR